MYQNVPIELIERIEALERRMEKKLNPQFFSTKTKTKTTIRRVNIAKPSLRLRYRLRWNV